jgi:uncharacterized membrane protein YkoI
MRYLTLLLLLLALPAIAGARDGGHDDDHDRVFRARQDAAILPLETILERLNLGPRARLLEVEYESEDGVDVYEIEYLTGNGEIREVEVDAATGRILKRGR